MNLQEQKTCKGCLSNLDIEHFYKDVTMSDGHLNFCKDCTKAKHRKYKRTHAESIAAYYKNKSRIGRKNYYESSQQYRERQLAGAKARRALKSGKLVKLPCVVCGDTETEGHHQDYSKPLDVIWLCDRHHKELHRKHTEDDSSPLLNSLRERMVNHASN